MLPCGLMNKIKTWSIMNKYYDPSKHIKEQKKIFEFEIHM